MDIENPNTAHTRVLIAGASPDSLNLNAYLRRYVVEGFEAILGRDHVHGTSFEFMEEQTATWTPDLVVVFGSCLPDCCEYSRLRRACDAVGGRLAFWLHEDPYEFDSHVKVLDHADHIFTNDRWSAEYYSHPSVWHLPLAASPRFHTGPHPSLVEHCQRDVFFCGTAFENRQALLRDLQPILARVSTTVRGAGWDQRSLKFCRNERIDNDAMATAYASARIVLNLGRDFDLANRHGLVASSPGPRTFEAAMAASCQMYFATSLEVLDYFEAEKEIVLFDDPRQFAVKLEWLLDDADARSAIGAAARARALRDHTYAARARALLRRVGLNHAAGTVPGSSGETSGETVAASADFASASSVNRIGKLPTISLTSG